MMFNEQGLTLVLPGDLMPTVSTALPLTIAELRGVSDAMSCLITERERVMDAVENMEVWE